MSYRIKINSVFLLSFLFFLISSLFSYYNTNRLIDNSTWLTHSYEVLGTLEAFLSTSKDLETGQRGFVLTGKDSYLEPFTTGLGVIDGELDKLQQLTSDNPAQQERISRLRDLQRQKVTELKSTIVARKDKGFDATLAIVLNDTGKIFMDKIRIVVREMKDEELRLLNIRNESTAKSTLITQWVILIGGILSIAFLIGSSIAINLAENQRVRSNRKLEEQAIIRAGLMELSEKMVGEQSVTDLAKNIIEKLAHFVHAQVGALYLAEETGKLKWSAGYAYAHSSLVPTEFKPGEGLVGQAAIEKNQITVTNAPDSYIKVCSSLGEEIPKSIVVVPFLYENKVKGVYELGSFSEFTEVHHEYLNLALDRIAVAINSAQARAQMTELLLQTQNQAEELQAQQEELKSANEELETQQEELRQSNEELEEQRSSIEEQAIKLEQTNRDIAKASSEIEEKAKEVEQASKYKSEFLANMSHELRTPLNSILLLSRFMGENTGQNLTAEQIETCQTVYSSGVDLLSLINDILDLSKVEAGKLDIRVAETEITELITAIKNQFGPQMKQKGLKFKIETSKTCPITIASDKLRIEQILKNFLSNALKFTESGTVTLSFDRPPKDFTFTTSKLTFASTIAISVIDTGIGIPEEKKKKIFEAFEQVDSTTSRKYGGAGLGLMIATKISQLLGGEIQMESHYGKGSRFTLYLPDRLEKNAIQKTEQEQETRKMLKPMELENMEPIQNFDIIAKPRIGAHGIEDDRKNISHGEKVILITEDDPIFAKILFDYCHTKGFKCLLAADGVSALIDANEYIPSSIILDLKLPEMNGIFVLRNLKNNPKTRHIPVHVMSVDDKSAEVLKMGAIGFLSKPTSYSEINVALKRIEDRLSIKTRQLLVIEDKKVQRVSIKRLIGSEGIKIIEAESGSEALRFLQKETIDCIILDLKLPDMTGFELLKKMAKDESITRPPVIIHTAKDLTEEEIEKLREFSDTIIIKGVKSDERLLDEVNLFLHRVEADLPKEKQNNLELVRHREDVFEKKKLLIVDDDKRNVFALRSVCAKKGFEILIAKTGKEALTKLEENLDTDIVLMDIMMPEMDGYEATQKIRAQQRFSSLPIIALTAKAMSADREKCLEAGASDYLSKPIDMDSLFSLLRVWLTR